MPSSERYLAGRTVSWVLERRRSSSLQVRSMISLPRFHSTSDDSRVRSPSTRVYRRTFKFKATFERGSSHCRYKR